MTITEFSAGITSNAGLGDIAADHLGNVWFVEGNATRLGRSSPSGSIVEFATRAPLTTLAVGQSGIVWASGPSVGYQTLGFKTDGTPIPTPSTNPCEVSAQLVTGTDRDDVVSADQCWNADGVARVQPYSLVGSQFSNTDGYDLSGTVGCGAGGGPFLAAAPGGRYWVTCYDERSFGIAEFSTSTSPEPTWFWKGTTPGFLGAPGPIVVGRDGNAWFTQSTQWSDAFATAIGRITPLGQVTSFQAGLTGMGFHDSGVHGITVGPDGNIWFTEPAADRIGRITPAGVITEFPLAPGAAPQGITAGSGRTLWFTEPGLNRIGRLDLNDAPSPSIVVDGPLITGNPLTLDGSSSSDADGSIGAYRWDLGDGTAASGPRATHVFERPGTYSVRLTVTDNEGATGQARRDIVVADPVLRVATSSASLRWSLKYSSGRVVITGSSQRAARVAFALTRARKRFELGEVSIPKGSFTVKLSAPRGLLPGDYVLVGRQRSGDGAALQVDSARLRIPAPLQGIVDAAAAVDGRGRTVRAVRPLGSRRLSARFRFLVSPQAGARIEARWTVPHRRKAIVDPAPKRRRGKAVVTSIFAGAPLPQGVYVCQLRAAGREVASLRMRIG